MELPTAVTISYAKNGLHSILVQLQESLEPELRMFENSHTVEQRDELISLQNEETNKACKQLIASEVMEDYSLATLYGVFRRVYNAHLALEVHKEENYFFLMNDQDVFRDYLEFLLLHFDYATGNVVRLHTVPPDKMNDVLKSAFPNYTSTT